MERKIIVFDRLSKICAEKGISVTALCTKVTGSSGNLSTWKKGYMRSDYLAACAEILDVTADYLLGRTAPLQAMPEDNWRVLLAQLSDESRADLEKYLDFLLWKQGQEAEASK